MPRSYWRSNFAIIGWLIAGLIVWPSNEGFAQTPKSSGVTEPAPTVESQSPSQEDQSKKSAEPFSFPVRVIENPGDADHARDREQKSDEHDAKDLDAQVRAANAAERAASAGEGQEIAARWQVGIAIAGTLALLFSLWMTYAALGEARKSSKSAELMAEVSLGIELPIIRIRLAGVELDALDQALEEDYGFASVRHEGEPGHHSVIANFPFRNYGRTMAFPTHVLMGFAMVPEGTTAKAVYTRVVPLEGHVIHPEPQDDACTAHVYFGINLTDADIAVRDNNESSLVVFGSLRYSDFMNKGHTAKFCIRWKKQGPPESPYYGFVFDEDATQ